MAIPCKVCGSGTEEAFEALTLGRHKARFAQCRACGFLFAENPHWLSEAYAEAIDARDIGIMWRNAANVRITSALLSVFYRDERPFLDFGGGVGIFTRMMRDLGYDFQWHDPYAHNILAQGHDANLSRRFALATSFETLEHFVDPAQELAGLARLSDSLFLSTQLLPSPRPQPGQWAYYGFEHGQHISFYTPKALGILARRLNLRLHTDGRSYHLLTSKSLPNALFKLLLRMAGRAPQALFKNRTSGAINDYAR